MKAVEMTGSGKAQKTMLPFPSFPLPLEIAVRFPHYHHHDHDDHILIPDIQPTRGINDELRRYYSVSQAN